ncbi:hypothetical protein IGI04_035030 [Brassica rapa subsp. trilocularis]|uniref:Uncharacterized protein n=1 Tax=Brassica rapa subsp. trilocularis TaxID=1813537 RepID=A0ABQ7LD81_BRACM|nr:hypothetical protein IGI04_035030 [Brassica rapa subsp. trilocularis]
MSLAKYTKSLGELSRAFHQTPFGWEIDELLQRVFVYFSQIKDNLPLVAYKQNNAERLAGVAPASRSRATFSVSDGTNASDLGVSLQQVALNIGSDFSTSLWKVAPGPNMCVSGCENTSDIVQSLWMSRSGMWCTATSCSRSEKSFQAVLVQRPL